MLERTHGHNLDGEIVICGVTIRRIKSLPPNGFMFVNERVYDVIKGASDKKGSALDFHELKNCLLQLVTRGD